MDFGPKRKFTEMVSCFFVSCNTIKQSSASQYASYVTYLLNFADIWVVLSINAAGWIPGAPYQTGATRHTTVSHVIQGTIWQRCAPAGSMGVAKVSSKLYPGSASPTNLRIRISKLQAQVLKILAFIGYSTLNSDPYHISPGVFVGLPSVAWCPKPSGNLVEELRIPLPEK